MRTGPITERSEFTYVVTQCPAERSRVPKLLFRIHNQHRTRIAVEILFQYGRDLARTRSRHRHHRPVIQMPEQPPRESANDDLPRHETMLRELMG